MNTINGETKMHFTSGRKIKTIGNQCNIDFAS